MQKKKILMLSDHALSTSGVGCQSRHLINGLIAKGEWSVRQFGAAMKHDKYDISVINDDFIIKPVDGFGTPELLRTTLATEKPDVLFIFTDPRFFVWLFEMEDEIHQMCPIVWWHVWDNHPYPDFNDPFYEATDLLNCHSHMTYEMLKSKYPTKTNFIPHALPEELHFQVPRERIRNLRKNIIGEDRLDHFVLFWINRNARRKRPNDLLIAWKNFLDELQNKHGHQKATLLLHTDPQDPEGPNLFAVAEKLGIKDSIIFSTDRIAFEQINILHNISDACINISYAEGFGLATLEAMQAGKPIIALKTGGLTRQVVDHRDQSENGVALDVDFRTMVGSQQVPFIYEDYCESQQVTKAIMKLYEMGDEERTKLGDKARDYVMSEFSMQNTVDMWHMTMKWAIENWEKNYERWTCKEL
tara:strand:- start:648 stop:1892 length:1245 start_codon:yes stop_codon:yes gene_type:complete